MLLNESIQRVTRASGDLDHWCSGLNCMRRLEPCTALDGTMKKAALRRA